MATRICQLAWLGRLDYQAAWDLQLALAGEIAAGTCADTLLLLEHPHTYTIGRRGGWEHVLWDEDERNRRGVRTFEVDRGGDVTYHGPGQLVGYPLMALAAPGWQGDRLPQADYVGYLRRLERALIQALARLGVQAGTREGLTGVWVDLPSGGEPAKLASIGVKVDARGISRHGFALNVSPDMDYWNGIVACGLDGVRMIALSELLEPVPAMDVVAHSIGQAFGQVFEREMAPVAIEEIMRATGN